LQDEWERINRLSVQIARDAIIKSGTTNRIYIGACITTLEDCYRPDLVPDDEALWKEHTE